MQTIATTYCTQCGYLYYGEDRKAAIKANINHGRQPQNNSHTIITEIARKDTSRELKPITILSTNP